MDGRNRAREGSTSILASIECEGRGDQHRWVPHCQCHANRSSVCLTIVEAMRVELESISRRLDNDLGILIALHWLMRTNPNERILIPRLRDGILLSVNC